ncbi:protein white, putative [Entamoeba invadens IP1]|uniref:Protein white, putative n=1 Tax=Entamoeba invadens IP1 TaxID=370355 RepID=A0A0A1UF74_ENTIV|nr:protein white, putative [Entamoeba invadens IP1]ELP91456.1 protein white, putative [Entamoeba invadens IP1]|eukprot:XP_004258227.1 protein white, putative [Entamoeba invadens IP1]
MHSKEQSQSPHTHDSEDIQELEPKVFEVTPAKVQPYPVILTFSHINYTINELGFNKNFFKEKKLPITYKKKKILEDVSGVIGAGELVALMGGSGAGKSTLLDILAGISKRGSTTGKVLVNNRDVKHYKRSIGYVSQTDYLMGTSTVEEALTFYTTLKSSVASKKTEREQIVKEVMDTLDLTKIRDSIIGTEKRRGVSGGEKKRVSIGCELVTNPSILFLDEPTTGLDAFSSLAVVDALQKLSNKGTTVICTIHQPRPLIFEKFTKIIMLNRGKMIYFGSPKQCPGFLQEAGFHTDDNIADAMMDAAAYETGNEKGKELLAENIGGEKGSIQKVFDAHKEEINQQIEELNSINMEKMKRNFGRPVGFYELYKRLIVSDKRDPSQILGQIFAKIFFALLIGSIFFDIKNDQQGIRDKSGVLFFIVTSQAMSLMDYLVQFIEERTLMRRESGKGLYTTAAYFFAYMLHSLPFLILYPTIYLAIAYPMLNLRPGFVNWLCMWGCLVLATLIAQGMFYSISTISPNVTVAQIIAPIVIVVLMIFTGFFIQKENIIGFWMWAYYLSWMRYAFELIMLSQFDGLTLYCQPNELVGGQCPYTTGEKYLDTMEISSSILVNYFVLAGFLVAFDVFVFFALHIFHKEKR